MLGDVTSSMYDKVLVVFTDWYDSATFCILMTSPRTRLIYPTERKRSEKRSSVLISKSVNLYK